MAYPYRKDMNYTDWVQEVQYQASTSFPRWSYSLQSDKLQTVADPTVRCYGPLWLVTSPPTQPTTP